MIGIDTVTGANYTIPVRCAIEFISQTGALHRTLYRRLGYTDIFLSFMGNRKSFWECFLAKATFYFD